MRGLAFALCFLAFPVFAQEGEIYTPPRTEIGEAYRAKAKREAVTVDARTLSADAPVSLRPPRKRGAGSFGIGTVLEAAGWAVLMGFLALLGAALFRAHRNGLFDREEKRAERKRERVELADLGAADLESASLSDLSRMDDPEEALRLLLLMGLKKAADANGIVLARSLTARDVLSRVPENWRRRAVLELLVSRAEITLFGGRPFAHEDLEPLLHAAEPMLQGRR